MRVPTVAVVSLRPKAPPGKILYKLRVESFEQFIHWKFLTDMSFSLLARILVRIFLKYNY